MQELGRTVPDHLEFTILGPLEARLLDPAGRPRPLPLGPFKQRALLAYLLCRANTFVGVDELIEALWEDPPATAHKNLQVYVSQLRRVLAADGRPDRIRHRTRAYAVQAGPAELDAAGFDELVRQGRVARRFGRTADAATSLRVALDRWRGDPLADLAAVPALRAEAARLSDRWLGACEDWIDAELALGQHLDVLDEIDGLVRAHPLRERLRSQQLIALYRAGRQSEALAEYDNLRRQLAAELGLQPSPAVQRLYQAVLAGEPSLERPAAGAPAETAAVVAHYAGLPRDLPDFVGHEDLLADLAALLGGGSGGGRVVALSGPPGVGKTALAVRLAHPLHRSYPDGRLLVALRDGTGRPLPPHVVLGTLLDQLGIAPQEQPGTESRRLMLLRSMLATRRMLLVYDDPAGEAQVRRLLPGSGPTSVLVTSRRYLGGLVGAHHRSIDPLPVGPAVRLLESAAEDRPDLDRTATERIARCCSGLPLALRIAGTRLGAIRHLPARRFAERLEGAALLDELAVGDLSMRAALDRYWQELAAEERAALRVLGRLGPGEVVAASYATLAGVGPAAAERMLEQLAQCHALQPLPATAAGQPRFRLIEPIRCYAGERDAHDHRPAPGRAGPRPGADPSRSAAPSRPGSGGGPTGAASSEPGSTSDHR
jgi:DNA-binding SARP family transcriptional activator